MSTKLKLIISILISLIIVVTSVRGERLEQGRIDAISTTIIQEAEVNIDALLSERTTTVQNNIDALQKASEFFLSNETMNTVLDSAKNGENYTTDQWLNIYNFNVTVLEHYVKASPVIENGRYYAANENVLELTPCLYTNSEMKKQPWNGTIEGWVLDYEDKLYSGNELSNMVGYVAPVFNKDKDQIGMAEVNMLMTTMFPFLYEKTEGELCCFITDEGVAYFGDQSTSTALRDVATKVAAGKELTEEEASLFVYKTSPIEQLKGSIIIVKDLTDTLTPLNALKDRTKVLFHSILVALLVLVNAFIFKPGKARKLPSFPWKKSKEPESNAEKMEKALKYINDNYNKELNMAEVSERVSIDYTTFSAMFKEHTGFTFFSYIRKLRIDKAKELLVGTDTEIEEVAKSVGYDTEKHFSDAFKTLVGETPDEYRKRTPI